jgi:hypothetical protein
VGRTSNWLGQPHICSVQTLVTEAQRTPTDGCIFLVGHRDLWDIRPLGLRPRWGRGSWVPRSLPGLLHGLSCVMWLSAPVTPSTSSCKEADGGGETCCTAAPAQVHNRALGAITCWPQLPGIHGVTSPFGAPISCGRPSWHSELHALTMPLDADPSVCGCPALCIHCSVHEFRNSP